MEYRYSTTCPVHGQKIETRRTQSFKYGGHEYSGPTFYCGRCKKYYLYVNGKTPFEKLKGTAPSGMTIDIRNKYFSMAPVKKKGINIPANQSLANQNKEDTSKKNKGKKTKAKNKAERKAIIAKNNESRKRLQESLKMIRCEMNCPIHVERVMTTRNCIDVESQKKLPLFYCIECEKYYISSKKIKKMQLGHLNRKDFWNCDCEITITNPNNGTLNSVGCFSTTASIEERQKSKVNEQELHSNSNDSIDLNTGEDCNEHDAIDQAIKSKTSQLVDDKVDSKEKNNSDDIVFDDWSFEDTEDELFKDFLQNN